MKRTPRLSRAALRAAALAAPLVAAGHVRADAPDAERETENRTFVVERDAADAPASIDGAVKVKPMLPGKVAPTDGPEALDGAPGVIVQRTNRGAAAPVIRGFIGIDNLLLLDGVRLNLSTWRTGPIQYAALIDPLILDGMTLLTGASGGLYGSGALGGVVNFETVAPRLGGASPHGLIGHLTAASADTGGLLHARGHFGHGGWDGWAAATVRLANDLRVGGGDMLPNSGYSQVYWSTKQRFRLSDRTHIVAAAFGSLTDDAPRMDQLAQGTVRFSDNLEQLAYVRLEHRGVENASGIRPGFRVTGAFRQSSEAERQQRCARNDDKSVVDAELCANEDASTVDPTRRQEWRDEVMAASLEAEGELGFWDSRLRLRSNGALRSEWVDSARPNDPAALPRFSPDSRYMTAVLGGWVDVDAIKDAQGWDLRLDGGLRVESTQATAPAVPGAGDVDVAFTGLGAGARAVASYNDQVAFRAGWQRGFRAPNLAEATVVGDTGQTFELPNPDLAPQQADTLEAGIRLRAPLASQTALRMDMTAFRTEIDDVIVRVPAQLDGQSKTEDGKEIGQRINADKGTFEGAELALGLTAEGTLGGLAVDFASSYIDGDVTAADGETDLPRRLPPWHGRAALGWTSPGKRFGLGAGVRFALAQRRLASGDRTDIRMCADPAAPHTLAADCAGSDGWQDVYLWATFKASDSLDLGLRVDNLLDQRYRVHGSGLDAPGLNARLGATVRL
jgi:hemoglobin/transferrin/lactoferrin receptor protein